jgi:hypothetical protein
MRTSESTSNVFAAFVKAQGALEHAQKGAENPAFKRDGKVLKYSDLADHWTVAKPVLSGNDLAVVQELLSADQGVDVVTRIIHKSGEWMEFGPLFVPATKHDAHGYGSACTYARRYAFSAAVGTVSDDDDGNAAKDSLNKKQPVSDVPDRFAEWWDEMVAVADNGLPALEAAFKETTRKDLKAYAVKERREQWANLKKHAAAAKVAE